MRRGKLLDIDPVVEDTHRCRRSAKVVAAAEPLATVGALKGFVVSVEEAVVALEVGRRSVDW
jgi:hypothetical protein